MSSAFAQHMFTSVECLRGPAHMHMVRQRNIGNIGRIDPWIGQKRLRSFQTALGPGKTPETARHSQPKTRPTLPKRHLPSREWPAPYVRAQISQHPIRPISRHPPSHVPIFQPRLIADTSQGKHPLSATLSAIPFQIREALPTHAPKREDRFCAGSENGSAACLSDWRSF